MRALWITVLVAAGLLLAGYLLGYTPLFYLQSIGGLLVMAGAMLVAIAVLVALGLLLKGLFFGSTAERGRRFN